MLNRNILKLVRFGSLNLIIGLKKIKVPSHISYADDAFIFYKGKISNIRSLVSVFKEYYLAS